MGGDKKQATPVIAQQQGASIFDPYGGMTTYQTPYGKTTIPETDEDYFGKLMEELYARMKARSSHDTGEIGYADSGGFSF